MAGGKEALGKPWWQGRMRAVDVGHGAVGEKAGGGALMMVGKGSGEGAVEEMPQNLGRREEWRQPRKPPTAGKA